MQQRSTSYIVGCLSHGRSIHPPTLRILQSSQDTHRLDCYCDSHFSTRRSSFCDAQHQPCTMEGRSSVCIGSLQLQQELRAATQVDQRQAMRTWVGSVGCTIVRTKRRPLFSIQSAGGPTKEKAMTTVVQHGQSASCLVFAAESVCQNQTSARLLVYGNSATHVV